MIDEARKRALPAHPSLEHLRKEAKQELAKLRVRAASAQLADAQLLIARLYGCSSWRALKLEVERRREILGLAPPVILGDRRPVRRRAEAMAWVPDTGKAERAFFPICAMTGLAIQAYGPFAVVIASVAALLR